MARRLLAYEADGGKPSEPSEPAVFRVYEKLRSPISALAGVAGFRSLAFRALTLAKFEAPSLGAVKVASDGSLHGFGESPPQNDKSQDGEGGVILIAELLALLVTFIGESLTTRLMQDVWPETVFYVGDSGNGRKL